MRLKPYTFKSLPVATYTRPSATIGVLKVWMLPLRALLPLVGLT